MELKDSFSGNCIPFQNISLLDCISAVQKINETAEQHRSIDVADVEPEDQYNLSTPLNCGNLSEFANQIVSYIVGFVVQRLNHKIMADDSHNLRRQRLSHTFMADVSFYHRVEVSMKKWATSFMISLIWYKP